MIKRQKAKSEKNIKRLFLISKVVFCIIPFATLSYLYMRTQAVGMTYQEILQSNPVLAVTFLTAMCQPFAAWLLTIVEKRYNKLEYASALVGLLLIFIAECFLKNWLGIIATALLFYFIVKDMPFSIKKEFKEYANWKQIILDSTGGLVLILLSLLCFYASLQIG